MDVEALRSTVEADPSDVKAFEALQDALINEGRLPDLKEVYENVFPAVQDTPARDRILRVVDQRARNCEDEGIRHWLNAQLGLLFWKKLENPDRAEVYFRRVKDAAGQMGMVGEFYTEFYARRDNWRRLEQLYTAQGHAPADVKRKLARVAEERGKTDKALSFWQAVYNADPSDDETYERLKGLYADVGKWHSLVELLKKRLSARGDDVDGKVAVYLEMIDIYREHIKSDTKVISTWQEVLQLQPGNRAALDALQTVYERMKRWPDLVRVLGSRIEHSTEPREQLALHQQIADIMLERFSNSSEAIKHYLAILEIEANNLAAITCLKELYEQRKAWEQYVEIAQREIGLTTDSPEARTSKLIQLAAVASERIRHPRIATGLWEEIRQNDPANPDALAQLEGLYERDKSYEKLVEVLEARVEQAAEDGERTRLLEKLGLIWGTRLKNDEKTAHVWKRVLELNPGHRKAFNEMRKRSLATSDWEALEWLYRNHGSVADLVRTLEGQVKSLDDAEKIPLLVKVADLWQETGQVKKAVSALESVLESDPAHAGAARTLIPIYESLGQWERLPEAYDVVLEDTADVAARQALFIAQATIHESHLEDLDAAFFCFVQAYQEDCKSDSVRAEFDRLAEASENWEVYVSVLEQVVDLLAEDQEATTGVILRAAEVQHKRLGNHDQALAHYRRVLDTLAPNDPTALDATEEIYRETEQWDELIDVLHAKLSGELDPEVEKALRFEIGAVWRDQLVEPEAAMGVYREMMERFPDDTRIYDELAHLHMQAEDWQQLSDVFERKLRTLADRADASPADLADLHCKLGMLAYSHHHDVGLAVEHYVDALKADGACELAVLSLVELLGSDEHRQQIALALEPVYIERGLDAELADVCEIQLLSATRKKDKVSLLDRLVKLYDEKLGDKERALWACSRLFQLSPQRKGLRELLQGLAEHLEEWAHLADLYEGTLDKIKKDDIRLAVYETIAQTAYNYLDDPERAERMYGRILDQQPEHVATLDALEELYMVTDQPEKLLGILRTKEALADSDEDRIDYRFQTASILADQLDRVEEAIQDMREVLGIQPDNEQALTRLEDLYHRTQQWEALHDTLLDRVRLAQSDEDQASLLVKLAYLRENQLGSVPDAIDTYARILAIDVTHADAVGALERLFGSDEHAPTIAPLLEPTYKANDDWRGLIGVYEVMETTANDPEARVDFHYRMARLYEHQGHAPERAFGQYGQAYRLVPAKEGTLAQLLRLADALDTHVELAALLIEHVEEVEDADRRREVHRVIAATLQDKCADDAGAVVQYRSVLSISDTDIPAIDALIGLYRGGEDWPHLVEMLRHKAPLMEVEELRKDLLLEAGDIAARSMNDPDEAIAVYEQVLVIDPDDGAALDALAALYEDTENWPDLCRILSRKIDRSKDEEERKAIARELAGVQEVHLEDLDAAIETHRMILGWDGQDLTELNALDELLLKTERWLDLLSVIDQEIELVEVEAKKELALRKARIWNDQLSDTVQAIGVLAGVLEEDPMETRALDALEDIVRASDEREQAFDVLEPFLELAEQWARVYDLLDTLVANRDEPFTRIEALHKMGAIAEERLQDPERAFACFGRALQEDLDHVASMEAVERLASAHRLWEQLTLLLQDGAASSNDPGRTLQLRLRAAEVLKVELGDMDRAIAAFKVVIDDQPDNVPGLEALDELYHASERWSDLADTLATEVDVCDDIERKVGFYFRLADVAEHRLGDEDRPFHCYREVFYLEPDNAEAIEHLERLARSGNHRQEIAALLEPVYVERELWDKLHEMIELRLEECDDELDRLDMLRRLAELNLEKLDRKQDAVRWFGEAFRLDPADDLLLGRMEELVGETGDWSSLKEVLLAVAIGMDDDERKVLLWHKGARILEEHLLDPGQAETIYQLILQADEENLQALQALDRLYVTQERWSDLEGTLEWEIACVEYDDDRLALLLRLGELLRDRLARADDAVEAFNRALELHETHVSALTAVADLYRRGEDWSALYDVVRRQTEVAESDDARLAHLRDMAEIAEARLSKPSDAVELWEEVLTLSPSDLEAIRNIARLHREGENAESLVDAIDRELRILEGSDAGRAAELYRELGRLWRTSLDDPLQAQEAWQQLLELEENDVESMKALVEIHEEAYNQEALARILEKMVASPRFQGDELLALWVKLARLWTDTLPEPDRAIWAWEKVRELSPADLEAVDALESLFVDQARWEQAVAIKEVKAGLVESGAAVEVWLGMGEVHQYQLGAWENAATAYRKVLELEAGHMDASERLESIYSEHEQWYELSEVLQQRADHLEDAGDKRDLFVRLAELYENRIEEPPVALLYLQAAHAEAPGDPDVMGSIERVATHTESWSDLLEQIDLALTALDDVEDKIEYTLRAARLLRDKLALDADAIDRFRVVLTLEETHPEALAELSALLEKTAQWAELVDVLEVRYENAPDEFERTEIGLKIGSVKAGELLDVDGAVSSYRRVFDSGESDARSIEALETIFTANKRWEDLIEILEAKASSGLGDETVIRLEIGRIREAELEDIQGAIAVYEDILTFDETQRQALDRLLDLYAGTDNMENLTSVYERLLETADSDEDQIQYCEALALLQQQVHDNAEAAADYYHRVLTIDGTNEAALEALEEIYVGLEQWEDLIDIYRRRLEQYTEDEARWVTYKEKSAEVYRRSLQDPDNAIYAYQELLDRVPTHRVSLDALEALYQETEQPEQVQEILERKADVAETADERLELLCRRAEIVLEDLADPDGALDILNRALGIDAGHDHALTLQEKVFVARSEWENVIDVLRRRDLHAHTDPDKADVQVRIADVYRDRLSDGMRAIEHYERAMEYVPDDTSTAERLAKLYVIAEDWVKAEALLSLIVERADPSATSKEHRAELHFTLGLAMENCLRREEALREYRLALDLAPFDMDILRAIGRMAYSSGDYVQAEDIYTKIIVQLGDEAPESELVELYKTLGQIAFKCGESEKAREYLEKTVSLQPGSVDSLKSLIELCAEQGYHQGVVDYAVELRDLATDPLEKFELQLRIGDTWLKHIGEPEEAVAAYQSALDYQPESKAAHFKIFQVLVDAGTYGEAVDILNRLVELEDEPKRKAQYLGAIGDIYREKLDDGENAALFYNRALDIDSSLLKLFRFIDEILTNRRDWKALQKAYRQMLHRVQDDDAQLQLQYKLCFNLGEIYRTRLRQMGKAKEAFELARQIKPKDHKTLEILADLYERDEAFESAIDTRRQLLGLQPTVIEHYRELKRLFFERERLDNAWVACAVLYMLGQADDREAAFYLEHQSPEMASAASTPDAEVWPEALLSRGEDVLIGQIFGVIFRGIGSALTQKTLKSVGLKKKHKVDLSQRELFTHVYNTCVRVLALMPAPDVYAPGTAQALQVQETLPPVLVIGDAIRQGRTEQELAFVLAKVLTYFHPLHVAVLMAVPQTLDVLFRAATKLFVADYKVGPLEQSEAFQSIIEALREMPTQLRESLHKLVLDFVSRGHEVNLTRWLNQIELSANHAGLLVCNDPVMAAKYIKNESHSALFTAPSRLSTRDKLVDLATYSLSQEYLSLREQLGITIEEG